MPEPHPASSHPAVRVFIASTFRDMHAERDHLVTVVFPELRERLERLGLEFYDVDLRWGVPEIGVDGEQANPWEYCKKWIDRVEPFFVSILGERYGWVPPSTEIKGESDRARWKGLSITEMEIRHAVLEREELYRLSYFYLRETEVPKPPATPTETYAEFVDTGNEAELANLKTLIRSTTRPVRLYPCDWAGDHFENLDEFGRMVLEDLWSGVLRDPRYVPKEAWRAALAHEPDDDPVYKDASAPVPRSLWERIIAHARPTPRDPREAEAEQMAAFAASRLRWFQGRQEEIERLVRFVREDSATGESRLCVVAGPPGQGKSALLARVGQELRVAGDRVIEHYVGATEGSASQRSLLLRLIEELAAEGTSSEDVPWEARDLPELQKGLSDLLRDYSGEQRLVLVLDAINQLTEGHHLRWLPGQVGDNVRVIASCIEDVSGDEGSPEVRVRDALRTRRPEPVRVSIGPLDESDVRNIVAAYLDEYCKELDPASVKRICDVKQARNPLYLLVMLNELRSLGGNDMNRLVPVLISELEERYPDTVRLFEWVLERLEVFGREATGLWCAYLALGRVGMSGTELRDLLNRKLGVDGGKAALRIERGLRRYLQQRGRQLDFFHRELRQAASQRYVESRGVIENEPSRLHRDIADYLAERWEMPDTHALSELPYHQTQGGLIEQLRALLWNGAFLQAKVEALGPQPLIQDYDLILRAVAAAEGAVLDEGVKSLRLLQSAIRLSAHWLVHAPHQLPGQLHGRLPEEGEGRLRVLLQQLAAQQKRPWLRPCWPSLTPAGDPLLRTLKGHAEPVSSTALTSNGRFAVSGSRDRTLKIWELESGTLVSTLEGHALGVSCVAVTSDGRLIVSGSGDKTLRVWELETGTLLRTLEGHAYDVTSVALTSDGRLAISGSSDMTLRVWDLETGELLRTLEGHTEPLSSVALTSDGRLAVSGSWDRTLKVWDLEAGKLLRTLVGHGGWVSSIALTPDDRCVVSGSWDDTLKIWDLKTGALLRTVEGHADAVESVALTSDGRTIVSASWDKTLRIWELETGTLVRTLQGHAGWINSVAVTSNGRFAVSGSDDKTLRVWNLEAGKQLRGYEPHADRVGSVVLTPDCRLAVSGSDDKTLKVWDLETSTLTHTLVGHGARVEWLVPAPGGRHVASGSRDLTLRIWDLETGELLRTLENRVDSVTSVAWTPDGRWIAVGSSGNAVKVSDLDSGRLLHTLEGHTHWVTSIAVGSDCRFAVSGSMDKTLKVWDLETGMLLRTLEGHSDWVRSVALTPDDRFAVSWSHNAINIWGLETGTLEHTLGGPAGPAQSWALTPDGETVVSRSRDNTLMIWDLKTGTPRHARVGHAGRITSQALTSDGRFAVSASEDKTLKVWSLENGMLLRTLKGHTEGIESVAMTFDDRLVISASRDDTLRVWDLETGTEIASFFCESYPSAVAIAPERRAIVVGEASGRVHLLRLEGCSVGQPQRISPPRRMWQDLEVHLYP